MRLLSTKAGQVVLSLLLLMALVATSEACPTCKDAVSEGHNQEGIIRGYFWSILFMMSMPFLIFGGLASYFYVQVRRARVAMSVAPATVSADQAPSGGLTSCGSTN